MKAMIARFVMIRDDIRQAPNVSMLEIEQLRSNEVSNVQRHFVNLSVVELFNIP